MIFGTHALDGENARIWYGKLMDHTKRQIEAELEHMRDGTFNQPDVGLMAYVFALNQLATDEPGIAQLSIYSEQVQDWQDAYVQWLETVESKISTKHRDGYKAMVEEQFATLKAKGSALPRDMW